MLERFKFWSRPPKKGWSFPQMAKFDFPSGIKIYLIGFSYDIPTTQTLSWLRDMLVSPKVNQDYIIRVHNEHGYSKGDLARVLTDNTPRIEIFCGHGLGHGLLGPPLTQVVGSILSDATFVIYDTEMITSTPSSMFAFCCQAAQNFGRVFTSYKDKRFMGFKDDIPFPIELFEDLKYLFQTITKDIIQTGNISNDHRDMFLDKLQEIASQSASYQNPTLIEMWLYEYKKQLMIYL